VAARPERGATVSPAAAATPGVAHRVEQWRGAAEAGDRDDDEEDRAT
jgi:hypothetical protein